MSTMMTCDRCGFVAMGSNAAIGWRVTKPGHGICPACVTDEAPQEAPPPPKSRTAR